MGSSRSEDKDSKFGSEVNIEELLEKSKGSKLSPEDYSEIGAIEILRNGLMSKDSNPRVFLMLVQYLYEKYHDYKAIALKIGGKWDDHTVQQWVRVAQAVVKEPNIISYLSERPSDRTLTVTKAYRIISKFQDAYLSLKVIDLMVGLGDREIAEILRLYDSKRGLTIRECREAVLENSSVTGRK